MSLIYLQPAFERAREIAGQASILEKIQQGFSIASDLNGHEIMDGTKETSIEKEVDLNPNEILIRTKFAIHPEIEEYLGFYGWKVDRKRRGIYFTIK